jgi:8-oxo-dGTP pyrophosphatase MutT (NUDIX family)
MSDIPQARPASTVVLLRERGNDLETLLLKRNKALLFAGGLWVFPGGALDPEDLAAADGDEERASRIAAAREAQEESGLLPRLDEMVLLSHWTTPVIEPRRFSTWIYAAPVAVDDEVVIDGGEIHDHLWLSIGRALAMHEAGELNMMPPTYITLRSLARYATVAQMVATERTSAVPQVLPVFITGEGPVAVMFAGDAGYSSGDGDARGPRHRAVLEHKHWQYIYEDVDPAYPPLMDIQRG